jgi:hypothetical protein
MNFRYLFEIVLIGIDLNLIIDVIIGADSLKTTISYFATRILIIV